MGHAYKRQCLTYLSTGDVFLSRTVNNKKLCRWRQVGIESEYNEGRTGRHNVENHNCVYNYCAHEDLRQAPSTSNQMVRGYALGIFESLLPLFAGRSCFPMNAVFAFIQRVLVFEI